MSDTADPIIVTVVYGAFGKYLAGWLRNLRATGCISPVHVIAMDKAKYAHGDAFTTIHRHIPPELTRWSGDYVRLDLMRAFCVQGRTCIQIDLDIYFNTNPACYCDIPYDFIVSRGLGFPDEAIARWGFSLCTGFYILKPGALATLDAWLARRTSGRGLEQENLNAMMIERSVRWRHDRSRLVDDALLVADDNSLCVLPDRAITRDPDIKSFGGIHHVSMLDSHL